MPVLPLALPWAVSPTSEVDLTATEAALRVEVGANYGPLASAQTEASGAKADWSWRPTLIEFRAVVVFAWGRMPDAGEVPSPSERYGRDQIPFEADETSYGPGRERFDTWWLEKAQAPDSGIYEVKGAEWLWPVEFDKSRFRHFVIEGHDTYVEVVAETVFWRDGSPSSSWSQCSLLAASF